MVSFTACSLESAQFGASVLPLCAGRRDTQGHRGPAGRFCQPEGRLAWDENLLSFTSFFVFLCLSWMSLKRTQAVPLCQRHCVIFYVVVVAVKL